MKTQPKFLLLALASLFLLSLTGPPPQDSRAYPADPTADIPWSAGTGGVADIQAAFNNARAQENSQLGTSIPMLTLPGQAQWNGMSDAQKALWLINRERVDRGVPPLHDIETNVQGVAQYYANYLLNNNTWGHEADGRSPWERLNDNPAIGACHDFLSVSENLAVFVTSGSSIPLPIERSIYMWMYEDGNCCGWGHRHAILWYPYTDNSGPAGREGFLGIGRAHGGPYKGPFSQTWPFAEIIVMNVFDPCPSWPYQGLPGKATPLSPSGAITDTTPTYSWSISADTDTLDPATWYQLWVNTPSGNVFNQWYEAADVCSGGTCSVTPGKVLGGGPHTWWVRTWNAAGYGPWSDGMSFNLPSTPTPGAATQVSPSGTTSDTTPIYTWNAVSGASWYSLWVKRPSGDPITQWYQAANVCSGGTCSVEHPTSLGAGAHTWWVQTWSAGGYGPWSGGMTFTMTPPGQATPGSPSGTVADHTPTYTWNAASGATWYYLWVDGPSGNVIQQWLQAGDVCTGNTCYFTPATNLSSGVHTWWVRTWSSAGYGPWSSARSFTVSP